MMFRQLTANVNIMVRSILMEGPGKVAVDWRILPRLRDLLEIEYGEVWKKLFYSESKQRHMRREGQVIEGILEVLEDRRLCERGSTRYVQWKRKDILLIALETMPKQVKRENVDNFARLTTLFAKKLTNESAKV
jgi:hypothetical protein